MMKWIVCAIVVFTFWGCQPNGKGDANAKALKIKDSIARDSFARTNDSLMAIEWHKYEERWRVAYKEPKVDNYSREVFQFIFKEAFGSNWIFRIEVLPDSSYQLTSKLITGGQWPYIKPIPKGVTVTNVAFKEFAGLGKAEVTNSIMVETVQKLSEEDWTAFTEILNGSYYWESTPAAFQDGIMDGDVLSFTCKSIWPRNASNRTLAVKHCSLHVPILGSMTDAYDFLVEKSILRKKIGLPAMTIRERQEMFKKAARK